MRCINLLGRIGVASWWVFLVAAALLGAATVQGGASTSTAVNPATYAAAVAQTGIGGFDCGPLYVEQQGPDGGRSSPFGSTVRLTISRRPRSEDCP